MGAGAAVLAAAQWPELVAGLVLVGPFVRDPGAGLLQRLMLRVAMAPPRAATSWKSYLPALYAGQRPGILRGQVAMVTGAGHYPQSQQPGITIGAVRQFLDGACRLA